MKQSLPQHVGTANDQNATPGADEGWDVGMYGLHVRTAIALPDWPAVAPGAADVVVYADPPAPPTFAGIPYNARTSFAGDVVTIEVRGVALYTAAGGTTIRVAPEPGAKPEDIRLYLTGAMMGVILLQRGVLPLHASCVSIEGTGVAFAASSGGGKSTLVTALLRRGAAFVTDDLCALEPLGDGRFGVWPGAARVKLDGLGMQQLNVPEAVEPAGGNRGKYHVAVAAPERLSAPVPLSRVYLLEYGAGEPRLERLGGLEAISALVDETYLLGYMAALRASQQVFRKAAELSRTLTVARLIRPRGFEHMDAVLELVEQDVLGAAV